MNAETCLAIQKDVYFMNSAPAARGQSGMWNRLVEYLYFVCLYQVISFISLHSRAHVFFFLLAQ